MLQRIWKAHNLMDLACKDLPCSLNIMEVCGTHTVSIFRNGIRPTLPANLRLLSGPGCPVCVTDQGYIENVLTLAGRDDIIIATYGDMIRVPSKNGSLEKRADNQNVKIVLSSMEALDIAKQNPSKTVVFVAVGFETTTPATAIAVRYAAAENIKNFCILSAHKTVVPAMEALLSSEKAKIDAFICPGHVSVIIGSDAYNPIVTKYKKPCVVAGFEPMQIIEGIAQICSQVAAHAPKVESMYHAVVTPQGNVKAKAIIDEMFEPADGVWRGIGVINFPNSTPPNVSAFPTATPKICPVATAAKSSAASSTRPSANFSPPPATPITPSALAWYPAKAPAPPGSNTAAAKNEKINSDRQNTRPRPNL